MADLLSEETFNGMPQSFKDWVQELGWKREEIIDINMKNEVLANGYEVDENGKKWAKWKLGKHIDVTVERDTKERHFARFERLSDGGLKKNEGKHE